MAVVLLGLSASQGCGFWQPQFQADWATRFNGQASYGELYLRFASEDLWFADVEGRCTADLEVYIDAVAPNGQVPWRGEYRRILVWPEPQNTARSFRLAFQPPLLSGSYDLRIAVVDRKSGGLSSRTLPVILEARKKSWQLGSLLLSAPEAPHRPWVGDVAPVGEPFLRWQTELAVPNRQLIELRTALFRKEDASTAEAARNYLSVLEHTEVLRFAAGTEAIFRQFRTEGLEAGEYLLQVYVFSGERLVAEQSRRLVLRWPGFEAALEQVDESLAQMSAVVPKGWLQSVRERPQLEDRRAALLDYWHRRASNPIDYPTEALESYFQRAERVDSLYREGPTAGTQTDRGRIWLQYGPPAYAKEEESGNRKLLYWHYPAFRLVFIFDKEGSENNLKDGTEWHLSAANS